MRDKIYQFLKDRAEGASRRELSELLFSHPGGESGVAERIVDTLLEGDERFVLREEDGRWQVRQNPGPSPSLRDATFVVVDLETTSLGTSVHHIIEIAAARVRQGKIVQELSELVNPGISLPPFIVGLTGITDEMLRDRPGIFEIWPRFLDLLGDHVIVAHNANFDLAFLNAVSSLRNGSPLPNPVLCTLKLARRLMPELKRRGLDALAAHFGIPQVERHRALGDVRITTEVLFHLLERCEARGATSVEQALELQDRAADGAPFECHLPRDTVAALPALPGIYRLYDEQGRLLYVGRARSLRDRVGSYLSNASGHSGKTLQLIREARDVRVEVLESELEAALTEAAAIRRERPPYNRLGKHLPRIAFLKLTLGDAFPRLAITMRPRSGKSRYFGPFQDRGEAERVIGLLTRLFQLRTCPGRLTPCADTTPCFEGQVGACTAPCAARVSAAEYAQQVQRCLDLLEGQSESAEMSLQDRLVTAERSAQAEEAARARRDLDILRSVQRRRGTSGWITGQPNLLILQPGRERLALAYVVMAGRLVLRDKLHEESQVDGLYERVRALAREPLPGSHEDGVDGMSIVAAWLRQRGERDGYVFPLGSIPVLETQRPAILEEWRAACVDLLRVARTIP